MDSQLINVLFIFILFLAIPAKAGGPLFRHTNPQDQQEWDNAYQDILSLKSETPVNNNTITTNVGSFVSSIVTSANAVSASADQTWFNVTSKSLTGGTWVVYGKVVYTLNAATFKAVGSQMAISAFSGIITTDHVTGDNVDYMGENPTAGFDTSRTVLWTVSVPAGTSQTIYLKGWTGFSAGTPKAYGKLLAWRIN